MVLDLDSWQEVWSVVRRNRLRTFLTALGVFWGVFMLIVMVGVGDGLERGVLRSVGGVAANSIFIWGERTGLPYRGLGPGRNVRFDDADVAAVRALPGVEHLAPRNQLGNYRGGANVVRGEKTAGLQVTGDLPAIRQVQPVELLLGRHLDPLDVSLARKVCVIGAGARELLFEPGEDPIGQSILIRGVAFVVIGVHRSPASGEMGERLETTVYTPFTTFQQAFNLRNRVGWFALTVAPGHDTPAVEAEVKQLLGRRHGVAPDDQQAIGSFNAAREWRKFTSLFFGIRVLIWIVGIATLLAGVVGVSNIMLIAVKERTREIGVRKALGATPARIVGQILQESIVLTALAGYAGIVAGVAALELVAFALRAAPSATSMFSPPQGNLTVALAATAVLIVSGALAGVIPARNAAKVDPVIALRSE